MSNVSTVCSPKQDFLQSMHIFTTRLPYIFKCYSTVLCKIYIAMSNSFKRNVKYLSGPIYSTYPILYILITFLNFEYFFNHLILSQLNMLFMGTRITINYSSNIRRLSSQHES